MVIDDCRISSALMAELLHAEWPNAEVILYDPLLSGMPTEEASLSEYDLVFLDYRLGSFDGLAWLAEFRRFNDPPTVLFVTGEGDELVAVKAIKLGAADYLPKDQLTPERLISVVKSVLDERRENELTRQLPGPAIPDIPNYRLIERLPWNGVSHIFLAERARDGNKAVLKMIPQPSRDARGLVRRLNSEFEILQSIRHPHVVKLYGYGTAGGFAYIAMEYLPGGSLRERMNAGITPLEAFRYAHSIALTLADLHDFGVVHRDLKPSNVMFNGDDQVVLIDFGIAKEMESQAELTATGTYVGTPHYMAPEQAGGKRDVDGRADLYSLGVILYEMLSGKKPINGRTTAEMLLNLLLHDPKPLPKAFERFQAMIDRLLAKEPERRFSGARELVSAIEAYCVNLTSPQSEQGGSD